MLALQRCTVAGYSGPLGGTLAPQAPLIPAARLPPRAVSLGGCGCRSLVRYGTYSRYAPFSPAKIVCYRGPPAHEMFSLLPDCFAADLTRTFVDLEAAVDAKEAGSSLQSAAYTVAGKTSCLEKKRRP
ncbi:MAG: hypothetical protein OXU19_03500 [bacterium]|nr:hypothetical protein [bacterium]